MAEMTPTNLRLALRVEGDWWNAYAAEMTTMDGAIHLGSIAMGAVRNSEKRKQAFMALMQDVLNDYLREVTGAAVKWNAPERAPEHERAGRA